MTTIAEKKSILSLYYDEPEIASMNDDNIVDAVAQIDDQLHRRYGETNAQPVRVRKMRWGVEVYD